jgi:hypothetical protein
MSDNATPATTRIKASDYPVEVAPGLFFRIEAAGTGDVLFVNRSEVLAFEINSESKRLQVVLKTGAAIVVNGDPKEVIAAINDPVW